MIWLMFCPSLSLSLPSPLLSLSKVSCIFVELTCLHTHGAVGITGLSTKSFKENWSSDYQNTNNAGIPDPDGKIYWNFQ